MGFEIRADRGPQGRKKLAAERAAYSGLMQQGLSDKEACRIVGINSKTGRRGPNGRGASGRNKAASPTGSVVPSCASSRYLSTISREVRRNRHPVKGQYRPYAAQDRADRRRPRPKQGKVGSNLVLRDFIQEWLNQRWSPEQICQALRAAFPTCRGKNSSRSSSPRSTAPTGQE
ncbi:hypothetical protein GCM10009534_54000 [Kribbella sandramycini]